MISKLKLVAYVALIALAIVYGRAFYHSYTTIAPASEGRATNAADGRPASVKAGASNLSARVRVPTNATSELTDSTNDVTNSTAGLTNAASEPTNSLVTAAPDTEAGNLTAATEPEPVPTASAVNGKQGGRTVGYLAVFVGALIGLGLLIAYEVTHYLGAKAGDYLFTDVGEGERDPEYELAEKAWVNGKPLEAIEMLREFLKENPREQYAALRIAEIYEKDLRNYVAASLEYEDILKKRLPAERWGWAAIHLCNLYSRLGQQEKTRALLEKIAKEYPQTGAAKKARQSLGLAEPEGSGATDPAAAPAETAGNQDPGAEQVYDLNEPDADAGEAAAPPPEAELEGRDTPRKSNLPPGFRKK